MMPDSAAATLAWRRLVDLSRVASTYEPEPDAAMAATAHWIRTVIAQPAPALNRPGSLCPFVPAAIERDLIFLVTTTETSVAALADLVLDLARQFIALPPIPPDSDAIYKSLLLLIPRLDPTHLARTIRIAVKPQLLLQGVTCGEFYPESDDASVRNAREPIARSPVPLIALRYVTPHDELFLRSQPALYEIFRRWRSQHS